VQKWDILMKNHKIENFVTLSLKLRIMADDLKAYLLSLQDRLTELYRGHLGKGRIKQG
jgi:hypothetical protein